MAARDDERFRPRPSRPRGDDKRLAKAQRRFTSQVLKQVQTQHGGAGRFGRRTGKGAEKGRGWVAARLLGDRIGPRGRRVVVKARLVVLAKAAPGSTAKHLAYVQRDGVTPQGEPGRAYGKDADVADTEAFTERGAGDRHQFRFIVSAEDAVELGDLKTFTRELMGRMDADLGTRLDWVAVDHFDTDNPHTHILLRGVDDQGDDLVIARDYIAHGLRLRASLLATEQLGPQTERELRERMSREVEQHRWTGLDRQLVALQGDDGRIVLSPAANDPTERFRRSLLTGRLQTLERLGLADQDGGAWRVRPDAERVLRDMGERGDIIRTLQRAVSGDRQGLEVFDSGSQRPPIIGRIARKGLADELTDRGYLVVDGLDGKAHYVTLPPGADLTALPMNGVVSVSGAPSGPRASDRAIASLADQSGVYSVAQHRAVAAAEARPRDDPEAFVQAHVRRLEALRRAGIAERLDDDRWRIPPDFLVRAGAYEAGRFGGVKVEVVSTLPIERQVRAMGVTWLDRTLIEAPPIAQAGYGADVRAALDGRRAYLIEQGLADRDGQRVRLARNLLDTLRRREIDEIARSITAETGLAHHPVGDGDTVSGVYRRSLQLVSGRFAMLDDGVGFSLVPWRPVLEQRLGQAVTGVAKGSGVNWSLGRGRGVAP